MYCSGAHCTAAARNAAPAPTAAALIATAHTATVPIEIRVRVPCALTAALAANEDARVPEGCMQLPRTIGVFAVRATDNGAAATAQQQRCGERRLIVSAPVQDQIRVALSSG